jgi:hypothetical protein
MGAIHHSEWRYRGTVARRAIKQMSGWMDEAWCYEILQEFFFFFSPSFGGSVAMAHWNVPQRDVIARAITITKGTNTATAG